MPVGIVDPDGRAAPKRFAVYRNNVTVSLTEAMAATFPAVRAVVGDVFFGEMALRFVRETPPCSPLLFEYGRDFAAFVANFAPAEGLPFLPDVAQLDRAWLDAYHAADAGVLDASKFAARDEDAMMAAVFVPHPALAIVSSDFPLVTIWNAARAGVVPDFADEPQSEWAIVSRPDITVHVVAVSAREGAFFNALRDGTPLGEAAEAALAADPDFDFAGALGRAIGTQAFSNVVFLQEGEVQ